LYVKTAVYTTKTTVYITVLPGQCMYRYKIGERNLLLTLTTFSFVC